MPIKVYNTLSKSKEVFTPIEEGRVRMYCCGPTVYQLLHVGNFRGAVVYNLLRNWLEKSGYKVDFVYNFTDVDDKIIDRANKEGVASAVISERYIEEFKKDYQALGLRPHTHNPKVSDYIDPIIKMIEGLIEKKKAYVTEQGEVLYSVRSFAEYGKLSHRNIDELVSGSRVEVGAYKRDPLDFALWKPSKEGEPAWDSPWGPGRPGWHIECSAMSASLLGPQIDIHGGGMDLIFPHHENEIAQSEGCHGHNYVKYWIHNNMINVDGRKMSKSVGNIVSLRDFLQNYPAEVYKFLILSSHYRSVGEFSEETIQLAISALARVYSALVQADVFLAFEGAADTPKEFKSELERLTQEATAAYNDDLNTPEVFAAIFTAVRLFNSLFKRGQKANAQLRGAAASFKEFVREQGELMALFNEPPQSFLRALDDCLLRIKGLERTKIDELVQERAQARAGKDFARSDELRDQLKDMGIAVFDSAEGSTWEVAK